MDEKREEKKRLAEVLAVINTRMTELKREIAAAEGELRENRADSLDGSPNAMSFAETMSFYDVKGYGELTESWEDIVAVSAAEQEIRLKTLSYEQSVAALSRLESQRDSAYFGRIDFEDEYGTIGVYIGKFGLEGDAYSVPYIFDWRAPIASMYYDFDMGSAYYTAPGGRRDGRITLKRQYKIAGGEIEYMFESEVAINDEILARALSESGGESLKVIVGSIQREQNAAIRSFPHRTLIITGPAGSGKSSVGMHRLAWILYRDRENLKAGDIAVVSQNSVFSSYIAQILPELGEADVARPVFDELIKPYVPRGFHHTDYFEQVGYIAQAAPDDIRVAEIMVKYSAGFIEFLDNYFTKYEFTVFDIVFNSDIICTADKLRGLVEDGAGRFPFHVALRRIADYIEESCGEYFSEHGGEIRRAISDSTEEIMFDSEIDARFRTREWEFTRKSVEDFYTENGLSDEVTLYYTLLSDYTKTAQRPLKRRGDTYELPYEDVVMIVYIKSLIGRVKPITGTKHVLIDEAQDFCLPQLLLLRRLYPKSVFTVLADLNQAVYPAVSSPSERTLTAVFPGAERLSLTRSYRCTKQIFALARSYIDLPGGVDSYERPGAEPVFISRDDLTLRLTEIIQSEQGTVGIITKTEKSARKLYKKLKNTTEVGLVVNPSGKLKGGVVILPVSLVKGLEFDAAVIADDFNNWNPELRGNLMYTLCTRALHRLYIVM